MTNTKNLANLAAALDDGTSGQVLQSTGSGGVQFADSSGSGVTTHTNQTAMVDADTSSAYTEGSLHFDLNANVLYVKIGSGAGDGFYAVATVENAAPTITSYSENTGGAGANDLTNATPPNTFTLTAGSNTVITINATEPNLETISYSATVTSGTATDVFSSPSFPVTNQSSNVFTLTPVTSGTGGTVTIRFDASDGTNVANVSHSFEIAFIIADSHYTTLLMATDGSTGNNKDDISDATGSHTITPYNDAHAGTFSPYRQGGYSTYFDGNDYLSIAHSTDLDLGTGNFTIEGWWRFDDTSNQNLVSKYAGGQGFVVQYQSGNLRLVLGLGGSDAVYSFSWTPVAGTWYHVCILRDGTNGKAFINGTQIGSTTTVSTSNVGTTGTLQIGLTHTVSEYTRGHVSDVRIVKGTAVYSGNFTPPTGRLTTTGGEYSSTTNVNTSITSGHTKLLTCHLPYISDGSSNTHSITVNGDPETKPFGPYDYNEYSESINGGSVYFDGNGDYLTISNDASLNLANTSFTIECWVFPMLDYSDFRTIFCKRVSGNTTTSYQGYLATSTGRIGFYNGTIYESSTVLVSNAWSHCAWVYDGTNIKIFVNGTQVLSQTASISEIDEPLSIGFTRGYSEIFGGYISDFRIVKGTAVYSGAFTPPSGPLTTTGGTYPSTTNVNTSITASNTSLLLKGTDAHVIDKSQVSNLKLVGTAAAVTSASSPTPPNNTNISLQNSVFLDGSGDCVLITPGYDDPIFNFGTGDWTIELWAYIQTLSSGRNLFSFLRAGTNEAVPHLYTQDTGLRYYVNNTDVITSTNVLTLNTWHHIALTRNGNDHKLYVDGYQVGSTWTSAQTYVQGRPVLGDYYASLNNLNSGIYTLHGYAQDLRITKGLARYTAADESSNIPSAPLKG